MGSILLAPIESFCAGKKKKKKKKKIDSLNRCWEIIFLDPIVGFPLNPANI